MTSDNPARGDVPPPQTDSTIGNQPLEAPAPGVSGMGLDLLRQDHNKQKFDRLQIGRRDLEEGGSPLPPHDGPPDASKAPYDGDKTQYEKDCVNYARHAMEDPALSPEERQKALQDLHDSMTNNPPEFQFDKVIRTAAKDDSNLQVFPDAPNSHPVMSVLQMQPPPAKAIWEFKKSDDK